MFPASLSSADINECTDGSSQCDSKSTTCNNLIPGYECKCRPGYLVISGDKHRCKGKEPGMYNRFFSSSTVIL